MAQKALRSREVQGMDGVIVPSEYLKRLVVGWGVDERKLRVIYNALPPTRAHGHAPLQQAEARARLNLGDEPLLLTSARLLPWKGVDHVITELPRDVRLLVAGDGPMADAWKNLAEQKRARVTFLGHVARDTLTLYMQAADYTVLYSGYEGLSHTLLESLRAGTPVIASDKGGNPEVVQHGINGLLVSYVDIEALAAALAEAFVSGKRAALAANTSVGMERFDFAKMVAQTDSVLKAFL
jgi:glycosyltransferase involved in cell wall biosynthesis